MFNPVYGHGKITKEKKLKILAQDVGMQKHLKNGGKDFCIGYDVFFSE